MSGCKRKINNHEIPRTLEQTRTTSPSGRLDAVLIRHDAGGAPGGWEWTAYVVPHRQAVLSSYQPVFYAASLTNARLVWEQDHLLEIQYDKADIHQFRNLWALDEITKVGSSGDGDWLVEVRLAPSSPDFSLLSPSGEFKKSP
jgi:hypothetical protein